MLVGGELMLGCFGDLALPVEESAEEDVELRELRVTVYIIYIEVYHFAL